MQKAERELLKTELKLKKAQQDKEQGLIASLLGIESDEYKKLAIEIAKTEQQIIGYDNTIKLLEDSLKNVGNQADKTKNKINEVEEPIRDLAKSVIAIKDVDAVKPIPIDFEINAPSGDEIDSGLKNKLKGLQETTKQIAEEIEFDFSNMAMGIADALGSAIITGENVFAAIGGVILNTIGSLLQQMGTAAVAASKLSATFAVPIVGAAAGLVAIGLGAAMKAFAGQIQNVKKFANGGIVSAPTLGLMGEYSGARSNPEVIAPLDKLKSMIGQRESSVNVTGGFRLEGQDLVLALQRAEKNRSRIL